MTGEIIKEKETSGDGVKTVVSASFGAGSVCGILLALSVACIVAAVIILPYVRYMYFALVCFAAFVIATVGIFIGKGTEKQRLDVTENMIYARTVFGSEMYLPVEEITAVVSGRFGGVVVTTCNYKFHGYFVKNRNKVVEEIYKAVNK